MPASSLSRLETNLNIKISMTTTNLQPEDVCQNCLATKEEGCECTEQQKRDGAQLQEPNNCHVQRYQDRIVFTTTDKTIAFHLMMVCEDANITESEEEFHYQGWVTKKK